MMVKCRIDWSYDYSILPMTWGLIISHFFFLLFRLTCVNLYCIQQPQRSRVVILLVKKFSEKCAQKGIPNQSNSEIKDPRRKYIWRGLSARTTFVHIEMMLYTLELQNLTVSTPKPWTSSFFVWQKFPKQCAQEWYSQPKQIRNKKEPRRIGVFAWTTLCTLKRCCILSSYKTQPSQAPNI